MKHSKPLLLLLLTTLLSTKASASEPIGPVGIEVLIFPIAALLISGVSLLFFMLKRFDWKIIQILIFLISAADLYLGIYFIWVLAVDIYYIPEHGGLLWQMLLAIIFSSVLLFIGIKGMRILFRQTN
jgi:hypothetical protein